MAFDKKTWVTGEDITDEKMNRMEDGIEEAHNGSAEASAYSKSLTRIGASHSGMGYITLTPADFTKLHAGGKYLAPNSGDASKAVEAANSYWNICQYDLDRPAVVRVDQLVKNSAVSGVIPIALSYNGVTWAEDSDRIGNYYVADTILASFLVTDEGGFAFESFSFTALARRDFRDVIVCRNRVNSFDSVVVFGDSIAADWVSDPSGSAAAVGNGVMAQFGSLMGLPVKNHALANATLTTNLTSPRNVVQQIRDYIASPDGGATPLFVIEGGTNDQVHYGLTKLGVYGTDDTATVYGAIKTAINLLLGAGVRPWQILVLTPLPKGIRALNVANVASYLAGMDCALTTIGYALYEVGCAQQCNVVNGYHTIFGDLSAPDLRLLMLADDTHPTVSGALHCAHFLYNALR